MMPWISEKTFFAFPFVLPLELFATFSRTPVSCSNYYVKFVSPFFYITWHVSDHSVKSRLVKSVGAGKLLKLACWNKFQANPHESNTTLIKKF